MFELPKDIEYNLKKKYPDLNISIIFNDIIDEVLRKTFTDGACTIRKLGKFLAYQTYSTRLGKNTCKFKFMTSSTFNKKISNDQYLLDNLPIKSKGKFDENNQEKCKDYQNKKLENHELRKQSQQNERERTKERLAKIEILEALSNNEE